MGRGVLVGLVAFASVVVFAPSAQGYTASVLLGKGFHGDSLSGFGKEISIATSPAHGGLYFTSYSGPGRTTRRGMFGKLGRFGSVALRFHPEGKTYRRARPASCTGGPKAYVLWEGSFTGSIRFRPEGRHRDLVRTGSFSGELANVPRWHCPETEKPPAFNPRAGGVDVGVSNCDGRNFDATVEAHPATPTLGDEEAKPAHFSASWTKSVGVAHVTYSISIEASASTAVFSDDLSEGVIEPPAPFHGQATIRRQGEDWEWSGSLAATFPGHTVSLVGPGFEPAVNTFKPKPYEIIEFIHSTGC